MGAARSIESRFSFKTFMVGLLGAAVLYLFLFAYLFFTQEATLEMLESRLESQTILIDSYGEAVEVVAPIASDPRDETHAEMPSEGHAEKHENSAVSDSPSSADEETLEDIIGKQAKALREAPVPGFFEETAHGRLPIAKSPMQTPFQIYKKPFVLNRSKPFIAVAVQDFGLSKELSETMISELPSSVSLILSPYSSNPDEWVQKARQDGHEVWLHMPIETNSFPLEDPGAKGLLTRVSLQYNQDRLEWILGRATGYTGIASFTDSALNNSGSMFKGMARNVFDRGLGFFELNTGSDGFLGPIAIETDTPYTQSTARLDLIDPQHPTLGAVREKITHSGGAVVVVEPSPRSLPALKKWLETLERSGTVSVPVSAVADPDIERN